MKVFVRRIGRADIPVTFDLDSSSSSSSKKPTVADALKGAQINVGSDEEVRVNSKEAKLGSPLNEGDVIAIVPNVSLGLI